MRAGLLVVVALFADYAFASNCSHTESTFRCVEYVSAYDGDTITVNIPGLPSLFGYHMKSRLNGIDTPEKHGKNKCESEKARLAQQTVHRILSNAKSIRLENVKRGKYFRIIADVLADGRNLSKLLLGRKLAVPYDGSTKAKVDWCAN